MLGLNDFPIVLMENIGSGVTDTLHGTNMLCLSSDGLGVQCTSLAVELSTDPKIT